MKFLCYEGIEPGTIISTKTEKSEAETKLFQIQKNDSSYLLFSSIWEPILELSEIIIFSGIKESDLIVLIEL